MNGRMVTISDLGSIVTGKTPSTKNASFFDGDYQFVTPSDLDWRTYYCRTTERTVTDDAREFHLNQFIPSNAVMVTCIGNTIGKCGISSSDCLTNQQINSIIPNEGIDPKFVYYLLVHNTESIRGVGLGGGSATPILNKTSFSRIKLRVPPQHQWGSVANILSAYDDLIENNRRRIALLEQAARLLYREWFVHLRFPGHEHTTIINGIPEGWRRANFGDLCKLRAGNTFKPKYQGQLQGDLPFIKVRDLSREGNTITITGADNWVTLDECEEFRGKPFSKGTSVFAKIGEGLRQNRIRFINRDTLIDNNMMGAIPDQHVIVSEFLYFLLQEYDLANYAGGAAVPFLSSKVLEGLSVLVPSMNLLLLFQDAVAPMFQKIVILELQSTAAARARDLLLPKLMNGEVMV